MFTMQAEKQGYQLEARDQSSCPNAHLKNRTREHIFYTPFFGAHEMLQQARVMAHACNSNT